MADKIFDDYEVDCNTCECYWNNQCDAVKIGDKRNCTSYVATRNVDVLKELDRCKRWLNLMSVSLILTNIALLLSFLG